MIPCTKLFGNSPSLDRIGAPLCLIPIYDLAILTADFFTCKHIFWSGYTTQLQGRRKEDGKQVLAGLAPSSQTVWSLLTKPTRKITKSFNTKMMLDNFTLWQLSPNSFVRGIVLWPYSLLLYMLEAFHKGPWLLFIQGCCICLPETNVTIYYSEM
jgi:hypothetical protein